MESHYHDSQDRKYGANLRRGAGEEFAAFLAFNGAVAREDGAVPLKVRELISVAVALTTQCAYCIGAAEGGAAA